MSRPIALERPRELAALIESFLAGLGRVGVIESIASR
jgi:hypothetical protein